MTVLQVCAFGAEHPGNFIASLEALEKALADKGVQTIYAFVERAAKMDWCKRICQRTKVYFLPEAKARILPKTYQIMRKIYAENDVAIVHTHFELYDIPATVTAPKTAKIFWHLHDALKENYNKASTTRKILTKLQYSMLHSRAVMLSVSEEHAAFANVLGFPKGRTVYCPNGINISRIPPLTKPKKDGYLLQFGWEVVRKGVDLVIQAVQLVKSPNMHVVIVGQEKCREYLECNCSSPLVSFHAPVNNINELYHDAIAFLHVSRAEGLSYALLEAVYAGLPVICSDIPENRFAKVFRNVRFVTVENVKEIASMMDDIQAHSPTDTQADAEYNRALICQQYSLDAWVLRLIQLYLE